MRIHADLIEQFGYFIDFECSNGVRIVDYYYWLQRHLSRKVRQYGHIIIYRWLGTCDVNHLIESDRVANHKRHKFIELRHKTDYEAVQ